MKKLIIKIFIFGLLFIAIFMFLDRKFYDPRSSWDGIQNWQDVHLDLVFMGNSHVHCDINPVVISDSLGINVYDLSSDRQPSEITYYNFKNLLHYTTPKAIVLEANILSTTINKIRDDNNLGIIYQELTGIKNPVIRADAITHLLPRKNWLEAMSQLFQPIKTWSRYRNWNKNTSSNTVLGYRLQDPGDAISVDFETVAKSYKEQSGKRPDEQIFDLQWVEKILKLATEKNVDVYIIKSPIARYDTSIADIMYDLSEIAEKYPIVKYVHNYSEDFSSIGLTQNDFKDKGHLNIFGAVKFSEYLAKWYGDFLGIEPDFDKVGWLKSERYEQISENDWRYTVELYAGCLIKFTVFDSKGNVIRETDYSDENHIDMPRIGINNRLDYCIKGKYDHSYTYKYEQNFSFSSDKGALAGYSVEDLYVESEGNVLKVSNYFDECPVQFAWYVSKDGTIIHKSSYGKSSEFEYECVLPGNYKITAFVRTVGENQQNKSVTISGIKVDERGGLYTSNKGLLVEFGLEDLSVEIDGNLIKITNNFNECQVQYAWYVYKDGEDIFKLSYSKSNEFEYECLLPGTYQIISFIRTIGENSQRKSVSVSGFSIDDSGILTYKP